MYDMDVGNPNPEGGTTHKSSQKLKATSDGVVTEIFARKGDTITAG